MAEPSSVGADALPHDLGPDDFQVVKLLGVGSQGKVYLVRLRNTDSYFAMKVFKKSQIIQNEKVCIIGGASRREHEEVRA